MSNSRSRKPPSGKTRTATAAAAREHARLLREEQQRKDKRRRLLISVGAPLLVVVLVIVGFVIVKANQSPTKAASPTTTGSAAADGTAAAAIIATSLKNIPAATFNTVGTGTGVHAPVAVSGAALTADNKPRVLYIGAEYCPYCAGERWAVVSALSRFGTFTNLGETTSSSTDVYPSTATLSFHGATYTSTLLSFTGVELTTNIPDSSSAGYTKLDTPSAADQQLDNTYNKDGSIPFVDFGNKYVITGASYDVSVLQGLNQTQIAAQLADPTTTVAKQVLGAANMMTAGLCKMTNNQPAAVCTSSAVTSQQLPT